MLVDHLSTEKAKTTPFMTVITACYNAASTIEQTITSVRDQRTVSIEHILIDGGSTDGTMEIVNRYRSLFSHVISEPDRGVYDAMQKGLLVAKGTYTGFLNADDHYAGNDVLYRLAKVLTEGQYLGISGVVAQIDAKEKTKRTIGRQSISESDLLWGRFPPHPATFLRTELMRQTGGFKHDYVIAGDFDLFLRVRRLTDNPMAHVAWPVTNMRLGGLSTSSLGNYGMVGRELHRALNECGYPASMPRMWLRGLAKLRELV
jgi:glycosyltransferase involved in cell wall biosynthesis